MVDRYQHEARTALDQCTQEALARVWNAERFSWWLKTMLGTFPDSLVYDQKAAVHGPGVSLLVREGAGAVGGELCGVADFSIR